MMMLILIITSIRINTKQRQEIRGQLVENQQEGIHAVIVSVGGKGVGRETSPLLFCFMS